MATREIITPEYLAEARARLHVERYAYRLFAFASADWPQEFGFSYVEEEIRETVVSLALNMRRLIQLLKIKKGELDPLVVVDHNSTTFGESETNLWTIINMLTHLERMKCYVNFENGTDSVMQLIAGSDKANICIDPFALSKAAIGILKTPQTVYKIDLPDTN